MIEKKIKNRQPRKIISESVAVSIDCILYYVPRQGRLATTVQWSPDRSTAADVNYLSRLLSSSSVLISIPFSSDNFPVRHNLIATAFANTAGAKRVSTYILYYYSYSIIIIFVLHTHPIGSRVHIGCRDNTANILLLSRCH